MAKGKASRFILPLECYVVAFILQVECFYGLHKVQLHLEHSHPAMTSYWSGHNLN